MYTPFLPSTVFPGIQMLLCHERSDPHNPGTKFYACGKNFLAPF